MEGFQAEGYKLLQMQHIRRAGLISMAGLGALLITSITVLAAAVTNGGFETGSFSGWTVTNQANGAGNWFVYTGTSSPDNGFTIPAPPQGTHAAITDTTNPGSHVLSQDVALAAGATHTLKFFVYYRNNAAAFVTPATLNYNGLPNQQYRVDIMKTTATPFSMVPTDILANVFRTKVGDPNVLAATAKTFDLTPFAGQTVRLRFAEVDNQLQLNAGVDAVRVVTVFKTRVTTQASKSSVIGGSINDVATLAGGSGATGTITFKVFGPDNATCSGAPAATSTATVSGNRAYPSPGFTPTAVGTYRWIAAYSGDAGNAASTTACNDANESVVVSKAPVVPLLPRAGAGPSEPHGPLSLLAAMLGLSVLGLAVLRKEPLRLS